GVGLVSATDGGLLTTDDKAHQFDQRGEGHLAGVLFLGVAFEQRIEVGGGKGMFDEAAGHDAERAGGDERLEKGIQEHGVASGRRIAISLPVLVFYQINNTLEGMERSHPSNTVGSSDSVLPNVVCDP